MPGTPRGGLDGTGVGQLGGAQCSPGIEQAFELGVELVHGAWET
jgi:hypothetical protein